MRGESSAGQHAETRSGAGQSASLDVLVRSLGMPGDRIQSMMVALLAKLQPLAKRRPVKAAS